MNMNVNLRADNTGSWIRTVASKIELNVWDLTTHKLVGTGYLPHHTFPARRMEAFQVPVRFAYASLNATGDATWTHWIKACGPKCKQIYDFNAYILTTSRCQHTKRISKLEFHIKHDNRRSCRYTRYFYLVVEHSMSIYPSGRVSTSNTSYTIINCLRIVKLKYDCLNSRQDDLPHPKEALRYW